MHQSTDNQRTLNNTMRHQYSELSDEEKTAVQSIEILGDTFLQTLEELGSSRETSLAKTKVEEAVFWTVKHIRGRVLP